MWPSSQRCTAIEGAGLIVIVLVVAVVSGFVASSIAASKGHNGGGYFVLGFFLPLIGILAAGFATPIDKRPARQSAKRASPLTQLRDHDDPKTQSFLYDYQVRLGTALGRCDAGELVLAFGVGQWRNWKAVFVLTDRRFIFAKQIGGATVIVADLDEFAVDEKRGRLKSPDGVLMVSGRSPFSAPELSDLIDHRHQPVRYVEMLGPGRLPPPVVEIPAEVPLGSTSETGSFSVSTTISDLERLDALHRSGAIDDDEFAELKRQLVWGDAGRTEPNG